MLENGLIIMRKWLSLCLCGLSVSGCGLAGVETDVPVPTAKAQPLGGQPKQNESPRTTLEPTERLIGGVKFEVPAGWEEKSLSSSMILGEYSLPGEAGNARLTLSTAGGGTAANLERWRGQFQPGPNDPPASETTVTAAGKEVTLLDVHGTFNDSFGGGGPKPNWQLLGVAIPIDPDHNYFVKLTGPSETVTARREEFLKFVSSARFEK